MHIEQESVRIYTIYMPYRYTYGLEYVYIPTYAIDIQITNVYFIAFLVYSSQSHQHHVHILNGCNIKLAITR